MLKIDLSLEAAYSKLKFPKSEILGNNLQNHQMTQALGTGVH